MATAPVKPQQLHNFPLSLKWGQAATLAAATNLHHNRTTTSSSRPPSTLAPDSETESDPDQNTSIRHAPRVGSRSARVHRFSFTSCSTLKPRNHRSDESPQKHTLLEAAEASEKVHSRVTILENNNEAADGEEGEGEGEEEKQKQHQQEEEAGNSRPWKLRPRKTILGGKNGGGGSGELKEVAMLHVNDQRERENTAPPKSMRLRGLVDSAGGSGGIFTEKEKRKFWISLSREEIEEDIFSMTGSRPNRRPRKRPKNVQKAVDNVFPGLWLVGTTADSYRVADPPVKR